MRLLSCATLGFVLLLAGCSGNTGRTSGSPSTPPAIAVMITTSAPTLGPNSATTVSASVANDSTDSGVTWTISPATGTLSSVSTTSVTYTSPTTIATTSIVTLTATSVHDTTKSASVTITLAPITVTLNTSTVTLAPGASQTFTAMVANDSTNAGVTFTLSSSLGALASNTTNSTLYYAPAGLPAASSVTLTATSNRDSTKTAAAIITLSAPSAPASQWVYYNSSGNLTYKTLSNADNTGSDGYDQVMDYSTAGYEAGAVAIPTASVLQTVSPSGDKSGLTDTANIQNAINAISATCAAQNAGSADSLTAPCGAVQLASGSFTVNNSLTITTNGVVLRGSGSGSNPASNTVITLVPTNSANAAYSTNDNPYPFIVLGSPSASPNYTSGTVEAITDAYVPGGALTLDIASASPFTVGEHVMVKRPATTAWISLMDMLPNEISSNSTCGTLTCDWITASATAFTTDRTIAAINGTRITLDSPLSDSIDGTYLGAQVSGGGPVVQAFTFPTRISQVGVEDLYIIAPAPPNNLVPPTASYALINTYGVLNGWARNLNSQDPLQAVDIMSWTKQFTVSNVVLTHTVTQTNDAKFLDFYFDSDSTQVLMDTVSDTADNMFFVSTSSHSQGPNVVRNGAFYGNTTIEPHQRWSTGLLVENTTISALNSSDTQGAFDIWDRGDYGTGQGWTMGWAVVWNSTAASFLIQQPPGSENWCIGCIGKQPTAAAPGGSSVLPKGAIDSSGTLVFPSSLYQAQLTQRLGPGITAQ